MLADCKWRVHNYSRQEIGEALTANFGKRPYAPDPPFHSGSPDSAPPEVVKAVRTAYEHLAEARLLTARRIRAKLNLEDPEQQGC